MLAILRESFAFRDPLVVFFGSEHLSAEIISFVDSETRNLSAVRILEIELPLPGFSTDPSQGVTVNIEIITANKRVAFSCEVLEVKNNYLKLSVPTSAKAYSLRKYDRVSVEGSDWFDALVTGDEFSIPCLVKIENVSTEGIGIELVSEAEIENIGETFFVESHALSDKYVFSGPYKAIRCSKGRTAHKSFQYSVALENKSRVVKSFIERHGRHSISEVLNCFIPALNAKAVVRIKDVSVSGFRGILDGPSVALSRGLVVQEVSTGVQFKVIRITEEGVVGFQLLSNTPTDRIRWLNLVIPFISDMRVESSVRDARALLNLFFEAGANVADDLSYKRYGLTEDQSLSVLTKQTDLLMRWVNISETGTILGHHSTYRVGLNSWYTGDLVGSQKAGSKADKDFFARNFRFLRETLECFEIKQNILGFWKPDHPYWQDWRNYIISNKLTLSLEMCDTVSRQHVSAFIDKENYSDLGTFRVLDNIELRTSIEKLPVSQQWLLGSLDVFAMGNATSGIRELYVKAGKVGLKRGVYNYQFRGHEFLVLLSQLPHGISVNATFDTAFVFPLNSDSGYGAEFLDVIYGNILCNGSRLGYRLASIRFMSNNIEGRGVLTEFFVIEPRGLGIF